jgi:hypothetical protein
MDGRKDGPRGFEEVALFEADRCSRGSHDTKLLKRHPALHHRGGVRLCGRRGAPSVPHFLSLVVGGSRRISTLQDKVLGVPMERNLSLPLTEEAWPGSAS